MTRYAIGLGSNIGDRLGYLQRACAGLAALGSDLTVSPLYESAPVGGPEQDPYLNAVAVLETDLSPRQLLANLHELEQEAGRTREVRWGPRTLDLDIVALDGPPVSHPELTVPHPRAPEREFVLRPLADVWPEAPVAPGMSAEQALSGSTPQAVDLLSRQWLGPNPDRTANFLVAGQLVLILVIAVVIWVDGELPGGVTVAQVVGWVLVVAGLALAVIAAVRLGASLTPSPTPRPGAVLVTDGPFAHARHPIYGGIILMALGASVVFATLWGLAASLVLLSYLWWKSSYEERQLRMCFPGYTAYADKVTRRLIPLVL